MRFCITSLRLLAIQDWKVFFEQPSRVDQILRLDPANVYATMDFDTRNSYREVIERLARLTKQAEETSPSKQSRSARRPLPPRRRRMSAIIWLARVSPIRRLVSLSPIRAACLAPLAACSPDSHLSRQYVAAHTAVHAGLASYVTSTDDSLLQILGVGLLTFLPATAIASSLVNWAVTSNVAPRLLPRLDFEEGIPTEYQTMVVIPTLLTDAAEIDLASASIGTAFFAKRRSRAVFCLADGLRRRAQPAYARR